MTGTDNKLAYYVTLKNAVILVIWIIKDDGKFYPQISLEKTLYEKSRQRKVCKHDIQKDGGIGASQKMRKNKLNQFLLIKTENVKS